MRTAPEKNYEHSGKLICFFVPFLTLWQFQLVQILCNYLLNFLAEHSSLLIQSEIVLLQLKLHMHLLLGYSVDNLDKFISNLTLKGIALHPYCKKQA